MISKTFLSAETVELLKTYIPTLPDNNPYLFPSNGKLALKGEAITYKLREAFKKAKIKIPKGKRLRFQGKKHGTRLTSHLAFHNFPL